MAKLEYIHIRIEKELKESFVQTLNGEEVSKTIRDFIDNFINQNQICTIQN